MGPQAVVIGGVASCPWLDEGEILSAKKAETGKASRSSKPTRTSKSRKTQRVGTESKEHTATAKGRAKRTDKRTSAKAAKARSRSAKAASAKRTSSKTTSRNASAGNSRVKRSSTKTPRKTSSARAARPRNARKKSAAARGAVDERAGRPKARTTGIKQAIDGYLEVPTHLRDVPTTQLTRDEILEILEANGDAGANLTFSGKTNARRLRRKVRPRVSREVNQLGIGNAEARSENLVIEGDNLQAMVTLYKERGHVDLILTDPPYNTGKDFRYNDRWEDDPNHTGLGELVSDDDPDRHTKWMRFMWPRLQMMKSMLKSTGVLAICIDFRELFRMGQMLDELLGQENRLGIINWQRAATRRNDATGVSVATEYILVYARTKSRATTGLEPRDEKAYANPDNDPKGDWNGVTPWAPGAKTHQGMVYGVQSPFTGVIHRPPPSKCWSNEKPQVKGMIEEWGIEYEERDIGDVNPALVIKGCKDPVNATPENDKVVTKAARIARERAASGPLPQLYFTKKGSGRPRRKAYLREIKEGLVPTTFWAAEDYEEPIDIDSTSWVSSKSGTTEMGNRELNAILGSDHGYETVKPRKLFEKVIQLWCPPEGLVLDPFAGSGTTGHAVLSMNKHVSTSRRFILIEQGRPERGDSYARTLTAARLQRVVTGRWASGEGVPLGSGFTFRTLGKKVDGDALLQMERDEMVDTVIASHFDAARRRGDQLTRLEREGDPFRYLVGRNADHEGFFLVWDGNGGTDFTEKVYEECANEAEQASLKPSPYHVYARLYRYQTEGVRFYQILDRILADFGLDLSSEPFIADDEVDG